jgi:hypothetical protein
LGAAAALFLSGCARDQATAAANIRVLAIAVAKSAPVTEDQALLLQGILCEADGIRESTEPDATPTVDATAPPATMAEQARVHAVTIRTIPAQVADSTWTWVLGAIATGASLLLGGGVGGLLAKRGAGALLQTAVEFGSAAMEALKKANPPMAANVAAIEAAKQEERGQRAAIRAAVAAAPPSPIPAVPAQPDPIAVADTCQADADRLALAEAQDRAARAEVAGHKATAELRRLWAENVALRKSQPCALTRKPRKVKRT